MTTIDKISLMKEFTYEHFLENRYKITQTNYYEALCNNGFIKLYAPKGRVYWHVQNQFGHQTPDWKFHISVKHQHLPKAWNLIAALFVSMKCRSGLKTYYLKQCVQPQKGRQITVYILKYRDEYKNSKFSNQYELDRAEEHSQEFWYQFVKNAEQILESHKIESNGLARGDLKIGKYISLRNEAYVKGKDQLIYPPNRLGWNAAEHQLPFSVQKLMNYLKETRQEKTIPSKTKSSLISIVIPIAIGTILYYTVKRK